MEMAKTEGGDNKIFQIVMVVITSIVAPLVIFFTTNTYKNTSQPTTLPPAVAQGGETALVQQANPSATPSVLQQSDATTSTVVAGVSSTNTLTATPTSGAKNPTVTLTATPLPNTPTSTATQTSTVTATQTSAAATATGSPASLTSGSSALVAVGTPVVVDNFELTLGVQDIRLEGGAIRVTLHVKNLSETARQFTFTPAGVTVNDGKRIYAPYFGTKKSACQKADLTKERTITIEPQKEVVILSTTEKEGTAWCASGKDMTLPYFIGPVSKTASHLAVSIKNFGPFTGFAFNVTLKR